MKSRVVGRRTVTWARPATRAPPTRLDASLLVRLCQTQYGASNMLGSTFTCMKTFIGVLAFSQNDWDGDISHLGLAACAEHMRFWGYRPLRQILDAAWGICMWVPFYDVSSLKTYIMSDSSNPDQTPINAATCGRGNQCHVAVHLVVTNAQR